LFLFKAILGIIGGITRSVVGLVGAIVSLVAGGVGCLFGIIITALIAVLCAVPLVVLAGLF
jgi:hypothetical protein